jgi:hypothetical protein
VRSPYGRHGYGYEALKPYDGFSVAANLKRLANLRMVKAQAEQPPAVPIWLQIYRWWQSRKPLSFRGL